MSSDFVYCNKSAYCIDYYFRVISNLYLTHLWVSANTQNHYRNSSGHVNMEKVQRKPDLQIH